MSISTADEGGRAPRAKRDLSERAKRDEVVKSAARVMRILEYFDSRKSRANVHAVATALGYPASSTGALLRSLAATGYLHHDRASRTYAPTLRVALLGADWVAPSLVGHGALPELMARLARRSGATVALLARNGDQADIIHLAGESDIKISRQPVSLLAPGAGYALLAALPEDEVRGIAHRVNAYARGTACRAAELVEQLRQLRRCGVSEGAWQDAAVLASTLPLREAGWPYALALLLPHGEMAQRRGALAATLVEEIGRAMKQPHSPARWPAAAKPCVQAAAA